MENEKDKQGGWWWPPNSRKAHYFKADNNTISLCRNYMSFIPFIVEREKEDTHDNSMDNCAKCKKLVQKLRSNHEGQLS